MQRVYYTLSQTYIKRPFHINHFSDLFFCLKQILVAWAHWNLGTQGEGRGEENPKQGKLSFL